MQRQDLAEFEEMILKVKREKNSFPQELNKNLSAKSACERKMLNANIQNVDMHIFGSQKCAT